MLARLRRLPRVRRAGGLRPLAARARGGRPLREAAGGAARLARRPRPPLPHGSALRARAFPRAQARARWKRGRSRAGPPSSGARARWARGGRGPCARADTRWPPSSKSIRAGSDSASTARPSCPSRQAAATAGALHLAAVGQPGAREEIRAPRRAPRPARRVGPDRGGVVIIPRSRPDDLPDPGPSSSRPRPPRPPPVPRHGEADAHPGRRGPARPRPPDVKLGAAADADRSVRRRAALAAGRIGDPAAVPALVAAPPGPGARGPADDGLRARPHRRPAGRGPAARVALKDSGARGARAGRGGAGSDRRRARRARRRADGGGGASPEGRSARDGARRRSRAA